MDDTDVLLLGIAVILFGGFIMNGWNSVSPYDTIGYPIMILGLLIAVGGLLVNQLAASG